MSVRRFLQFLFSFLAAAWSCAPAVNGGDGLQEIPAQVTSFLAIHCVRCHSGDEPKAQFRLDAEFTTTLSAEAWTEVVLRLRAGDMPPKEEPRPDSAHAEQVVDWLTLAIQEAESSALSAKGAAPS